LRERGPNFKGVVGYSNHFHWTDQARGEGLLLLLLLLSHHHQTIQNDNAIAVD